MKLKNKKTGDIIESYIIETASAIGSGLILQDNDTNKRYQYNSLSELNDDWEDVEEPKVFWYIEGDGDIHHIGTELCDELEIHTMKQIGNYFETREEAEKAVDKLKAWTRLKDKGFKVDLWDYDGGNYQEKIRTGRILFRVADDYPEKNIDKDLDLLFGGGNE